MFGELVGLWLADLWDRAGRPDAAYVELGPGRGTLAADALRAMAKAGLRPPVHFVETSPVRRQAQAGRVPDAVRWAERIEDIPEGPLLLVANEFFDALPIEQYFYDKGQWHQRLIDFHSGDGLSFVAGPTADPGIAGKDGDIFETCPEGLRIAGLLGQRLARQDGAALIVDYGHVRTAVGDTLQAVRSHKFHPVLENPGQADVTAHVDFQALAEAAIPARAHGPVTQGDFLRGLGIETRAALLAKGQSPGGAAKIAADMHRLIEPGEMGTLFKVMALAHPARGSLIGF
jgi:SAM-dependent MidA family methyltransferase